MLKRGMGASLDVPPTRGVMTLPPPCFFTDKLPGSHASRPLEQTKNTQPTATIARPHKCHRSITAAARTTRTGHGAGLAARKGDVNDTKLPRQESQVSPILAGVVLVVPTKNSRGQSSKSSSTRMAQDERGGKGGLTAMVDGENGWG